MTSPISEGSLPQLPPPVSVEGPAFSALLKGSGRQLLVASQWVDGLLRHFRRRALQNLGPLGFFMDLLC